MHTLSYPSLICYIPCVAPSFPLPLLHLSCIRPHMSSYDLFCTGWPPCSSTRLALYVFDEAGQVNLNISTHVFAVSSFCTHFFVVHLSSREIDWSLGMTDHHSLNVPLRLKLPIWCNKHQVLLIDYYFHKSSVFTYTPHPSINSLPTILCRQFILFLSSPQITFYPSFLFG